MSTPEPPIPAEIWERMVAFLNAPNKTGKIILVVIESRVVDCEIAERIRAHRKQRKTR